MAPSSSTTTTPTTSAVEHGQCLSETWSRCVKRSVTARHNFELASFAALEGMGVAKFVSSSTFSVGGSDWRIDFYPDGNEADDKGASSSMSVFLYLVRGAAGVATKFSISLVCKEHDRVLLGQTASRTFPKVGSDWGFVKFIEKSKMQELMNRKHHDSFTIRCVLTVERAPHTEEGNAIAVPEPNLIRDLTDMFKKWEGADVMFGVAGRSFPAHRCILAARSTVFRAELLGAMREKDAPYIQIDDMEPTVFEALLHFIYTDSLPDGFNDSEDAVGTFPTVYAPKNDSEDKNVKMQHMLVAADRYGIERLRLMCEAKLCQDVNVQSAATTLALAEQHNCKQLKDACIGFIASQDVLGAVMKTGGFKHLMASCPLIMKEILDKVATVWNE